MSSIPLTSTLNEVAEVFVHPIKGRGLKAKHDIALHQIILQDKPYITRISSNVELNNISTAYHWLTENDPIKMEKLNNLYFNPKKQIQLPDQCPINGITLQQYQDTVRRVSTNSFLIPYEGQKYSVLYLDISMINHSCEPNAVFDINAHPLEGIIIAHTAIKQGDEICISYIDGATKTKTERKELLEKAWGFDCKCDKCELCE
jgi:hypothetical protein